MCKTRELSTKCVYFLRLLRDYIAAVINPLLYGAKAPNTVKTRELFIELKTKLLNRGVYSLIPNYYTVPRHLIAINFLSDL